MKKLTKWVLLMDGSKVKILKKDDNSEAYIHIYGTEHIEKYHQTHAHGHNHGSPKQHGGSHEGHHVFPPSDDPKEIDKENFVKKITHFLKANKDVYDKLVLIAPDRILGYLHASLDKEVKEKVFQEIRKDLTRVPLDELSSYLT